MTREMIHLQVNIIRMPLQLYYFSEYQRRVSAMIGAQRTKQLVNQALVLITVGGNDFVNNYYLVPNSVRSRQYSLQDYVPFLISEYRKLLLVNAPNCLESSLLIVRLHVYIICSMLSFCCCCCRGYMIWELEG